ncbi:helicase C-terminal domain-containing protein [Rhodococcus rhodochrous]|nr:helicase C-terminal domain-containing protein [Rhodococcus rhodochrous]
MAEMSECETEPDFVSVRNELVSYLRRELVGPAGGADEVIWEPPNRRYLMGTLFPESGGRESSVRTTGLVDDVQEDGTGDFNRTLNPVTAVEDLEPERTPAASYLPSSLGLTAFTTASSLSVGVTASRYLTVTGSAGQDTGPGSTGSGIDSVESSGTGVGNVGTVRDIGGKKRRWVHQPAEDEVVSVSGAGTFSVLSGAGIIDVKWRPVPAGALVTITLRNSHQTPSGSKPEGLWDKQLFQCGLSIRCSDGEFLEYPSASAVVADEEADELALRFRAHRTFAVGHGCAAMWGVTDDSVDHVWADVLPQYTVPSVAPAGDVDERAVDQRYLAYADDDRDVVRAALLGLVDSYERWSNDLAVAAANLGGRDAAAAGRILGRILSTLGRMRRGVDVLTSGPDDRPFEAFVLANRAMLLQAVHSGAELAGVRRALSEPADLTAPDGSARSWRPFQMGFFLTVVGGLVDDQDEDRETVDLLWFPTGGGKTEAYLLLAAFEMIRRRLVEGAAGAGTAVLSRYTLSLLTTQQFQRAAGMVLACEWLRRQGDRALGERPFSIGLWVGDATTPNKLSKAAELFTDLRHAQETEDVFLLERCPWCGTEIVPRTRSRRDADYGIVADNTKFTFKCPRVDCEFHDVLPVHVVDQDLYQKVPSFVLGTVDKFADLAWEGRGGCFFGNGGEFLPPSLIIQDELHLLTGPLGTTVGLYEHAIGMLCETGGRPSKVIASTATVRRASEQVLGLYGRRMAVFPPPGLDESDSFFARTDLTAAGRTYVGIMAQGHTSDSATVHTSTALLQAPIALGLEGPERDLFWTQVVYHGSLRELGRTVTMAGDDIPARLATMFDTEARRVEVEELTSNIRRSEQPALLERLSKTVGEPGCVDVLASTNMISVGVDVPRLGLMLVNGQPKGTAEYIQATSRVGRRDPGLVVGLFRPTRPRDRSHYEGFRAYHSSLYRFVEPSSVTPYSAPSRARALHAAFVIIMRHKVGLRDGVDAGRIREVDGDARAMIDQLVEVADRVDRRESANVRLELERFLDEWCSAAAAAEASGRRLHFASTVDDDARLLRDFWKGSHGVPTMRSMRNVDRQGEVYVLGTPKRSRK